MSDQRKYKHLVVEDHPELIEQTNNGPREKDGPQPDDDVQQPGVERTDLI